LGAFFCAVTAGVINAPIKHNTANEEGLGEVIVIGFSRGYRQSRHEATNAICVSFATQPRVRQP
jgi:hypothetical protein